MSSAREVNDSKLRALLGMFRKGTDDVYAEFPEDSLATVCSVTFRYSYVPITTWG